MSREDRIGQRVGAIRNATSETVNLFGYGVFEGDKPCPKFGNIPNPCIKLDDGQIVWGMECWWGPEEKIKASIGERKVNIVAVE